MQSGRNFKRPGELAESCEQRLTQSSHLPSKLSGPQVNCWVEILALGALESFNEFLQRIVLFKLKVMGENASIQDCVKEWLICYGIQLPEYCNIILTIQP